jgi:cytochrome P450
MRSAAVREKIQFAAHEFPAGCISLLYIHSALRQTARFDPPTSTRPFKYVCCTLGALIIFPAFMCEYAVRAVGSEINGNMQSEQGIIPAHNGMRVARS